MNPAVAICAVLVSAFATNAFGQNWVKATVQVDFRVRGPRVPEDFVSLSYETSQLADPNYFSASNKQMIALFQRLGKKGVLRIGGNTSEFTDWLKATPGKGEKRHLITTRAIENLAAFAQATGWRVIYGLNLGSGKPESDAEEAAFVHQTLGKSLIAFQIGNEPDLYNQNLLRSSKYGVADYLREWTAIYEAVRAKTPEALFGGPDGCYYPEWVEGFAKHVHGKKDVVFLSSHFYPMGPPEDPKNDIARMLATNPWFESLMVRYLAAGKAAGLPYRNTEGNTCWNGGRAGVSNAFASALYCGDFMLHQMELGSQGMAFHTGGECFYTPIAGFGDKGFTVRPPYYGILMAAQFAGATMTPCALDAKGVNVRAFAGCKDGKQLLAIVNKDLRKGLRVTLPTNAKSATVWRLQAPAPESLDRVTLAGSVIGRDGGWQPRSESLSISKLRLHVDVPRAQAVLIFLH